MNEQRISSLISIIYDDGKAYELQLFAQENDQTELIDHRGNKLLSISATTVVRDSADQVIGCIRMDSNENHDAWYWQPKDGVIFGEIPPSANLYQVEREVCVAYLKNLRGKK